MAKSKSQKKPRLQNKKPGDVKTANESGSKSDSALDGASESETSTSGNDSLVKTDPKKLDPNPTTPRPVLFKIVAAVFAVWLIFLAYVAYIVLSQG